jgi:hypothetical protein
MVRPQARAPTPGAHLATVDAQKLGYPSIIGARVSGFQDDPHPAHQLLRTSSLAALKPLESLSLRRGEYDWWWFGTAHEDESSPPLDLDCLASNYAINWWTIFTELY